MFVGRHQFFRWTPRTTWLTFTYVIAVPAAFLYMGFKTEVSCPRDMEVDSEMACECGIWDNGRH